MKNLIASLLSPLTGALLTPILFIKLALNGLILYCLWNLLLICGANIPDATYAYSMFGAMIAEVARFVLIPGEPIIGERNWDKLGNATATKLTYASMLIWGLLIFKWWIL